jgi:signal transduction histidine kinase
MILRISNYNINANSIVITKIPSFGLVIRANADQIQQVLTNLITNAWEGADRNQGNIGLTVKTVSQEDIPASKRFPIDWQPQESVYACIEVTDTGCGNESKDIEKIFDPFFTTKFIGRGMGLSVVLGIVRSGGITAESEPGRGVSFVSFQLKGLRDTISRVLANKACGVQYVVK